MSRARELLRRLAEPGGVDSVDLLPAGALGDCALDRRTRALVQLSALVAGDASTASLRWAADNAAMAGADDATLLRVLTTAASASGSAQMVKSAPRLALAIDVDIEVDGWDGT